MEWTAHAEGDWVYVAVRQRDDGRGLYRAYLCGRGGRFDLGAMTPEGGVLVLNRRVALSALRACGAWPATGAEGVLHFPFRQQGGQGEGWERPEGRLTLCDALLDRAAADCGGVLLSPRPTGFRLAFPYTPTAPFPIPPLFCFARIRKVEGARRVVYSFDRAGRPIFE